MEVEINTPLVFLLIFTIMSVIIAIQEYIWFKKDINKLKKMEHITYDSKTGKYQCQYNSNCKMPELDTVTGSSCVTCKLKESYEKE